MMFLLIFIKERQSFVGESGSGKSVSALSILQLLPYPLATHPTGVSTLPGKTFFE